MARKLNRRGKSDVFGDITTVDHLRAWYELFDETAAENEWIGEIGCRAPQADAAVCGMLEQQFLVHSLGTRMRSKRER